MSSVQERGRRGADKACSSKCAKSAPGKGARSPQIVRLNWIYDALKGFCHSQGRKHRYYTQPAGCSWAAAAGTGATWAHSPAGPEAPGVASVHCWLVRGR